jgi:hypothetical protein
MPQQYMPFQESDFALMSKVDNETIPEVLSDKVEKIRGSLAQYPEFQFGPFKRHVLRRPEMNSRDGFIFAPPVVSKAHWYCYSIGGEEDQVHLNFGMWPTHVRVGMGFTVGRQARPTLPAFRQFQSFLGVRPPLLFRDQFHRCVKRNRFGFEEAGMPYWGDAYDILHMLESDVAPSLEEAAILLFVGAMWKPEEAVRKTVADIRDALRDLMPFFEALVLMGGRFQVVEG